MTVDSILKNIEIIDKEDPANEQIKELQKLWEEGFFTKENE